MALIVLFAMVLSLVACAGSGATTAAPTTTAAAAETTAAKPKLRQRRFRSMAPGQQKK